MYCDVAETDWLIVTLLEPINAPKQQRCLFQAQRILLPSSKMFEHGSVLEGNLANSNRRGPYRVLNRRRNKQRIKQVRK